MSLQASGPSPVSPSACRDKWNQRPYQGQGAHEPNQALAKLLGASVDLSHLPGSKLSNPGPNKHSSPKVTFNTGIDIRNERLNNDIKKNNNISLNTKEMVDFFFKVHYCM